jgi:hypothetical protein
VARRASRSWDALSGRTQQAYSRRAGGEAKARRLYAAGDITSLRGHQPGEHRTRRPTTGERRYSSELRRHRAQQARKTESILTPEGLVHAPVGSAPERARNARFWGDVGRLRAGKMTPAAFDQHYAGRTVAGRRLPSAADVLRLSIEGRLPRGEDFLLYSDAGAAP